MPKKMVEELDPYYDYDKDFYDYDKDFNYDDINSGYGNNNQNNNYNYEIELDKDINNNKIEYSPNYSNSNYDDYDSNQSNYNINVDFINKQSDSYFNIHFNGWHIDLLSLILWLAGLLIALYVLFHVFRFIINIRNGIVERRMQYQKQRADLELLYRRREKLIRRIYDIALALVDKQSDLHTRLMAEMKEALAHPGQRADINILNLSSLLPDIAAAPNFSRTQEEITRLDNEIVYAARKLNEIIREHNTYIKVFPNNIVAALFGYRILDPIGDLSTVTR